MSKNKKIEADRLKEFKSNPDLKILYDTELKKYGNPPFLAQGAFADVFRLPQNKVLRIELGFHGINYGRRKRETMLNLMKSSALNNLDQKITPKIFDIQLLQIGSTWITSTIMESLQILKWKEWEKVFSSDKELALAVFRAVDTLIKFDIYHMDINSGNLVLTPAGLCFVDLDDVCINIPQLEQNCSQEIMGTPGYVGPEWAKLKPLFFSSKPLQERKSWYKYQMYYAAGKLIYYIITDRDVEKVKLDLLSEPVRVLVKNAINPTAALRSIPVLRGIATNNVIAVAKESKEIIKTTLAALEDDDKILKKTSLKKKKASLKKSSLKKSSLKKKKISLKKPSANHSNGRQLRSNTHCHGKTQADELCKRKVGIKRCCKSHEKQPICKKA